ncbi:MAG: hypothetical protein ACLRWP_17495, partial [Bilophila wadsworthia]
FKATPGSFDVKLRNLYSVEAGKACYTDGDMSVVDPSSGKGVNVRISAMCGEVPDGRCLIQGIHASLPSGEQPDGEFFPTSFLGEGNELSSQSRRSAFQLLKNSIPGGLIGGYIERASPLFHQRSAPRYLDIVSEDLWRTREGWLKTVSIPATATASTL